MHSRGNLPNDLIKGLALIILVSAIVCSGATALASGQVTILCYHSIQPNGAHQDHYTISQNDFTAQMEYLHTHGYTPINLKDLLAARKGDTMLPEKPVMLTFDDGYRSYAEFVVPLLNYYGFPSMLAVVGSWIDGRPPQGLPEPLLSWERLRMFSSNPLVTIVSHTYDLHKGVRYTPQGNQGAAVGVRLFPEQDASPESEEQYYARLKNDFSRQQTTFIRELGTAPAALVWPYGHYNAISLEIAKSFGIQATFALDEKERIKTDVQTPDSYIRHLVVRRPIEDFIGNLQKKAPTIIPLRAVQVDLDTIYTNQGPEAIERNLAKLVQRLVGLGVNTVYLQAFADPDGTGNVREVYFHNRFLPVRADIFAHAVHQIKVHGIRVYAWMPVLGYHFPDEDFNQRHRVRQYDDERPANAGYIRLSPFSEEACARIGGLYADLASGAQISGILFQDDAFLGDREDFYPQALSAFASTLGKSIDRKKILTDDDLNGQWTAFKTERLIDFTQQLAGTVRRYRPDALFARNIYARLLYQPESEAWFAQNYHRFLKAYDYTVVMAYPRMEQIKRPLPWLRELAASAAQAPMGLDKTVFKLQTHDWRSGKWIAEDDLLRQMRTCLAAGIRHLAYYPDDVLQDRPRRDRTKLEMSTRSTIANE